MVILYYTLLVGYILLWDYGTLVLHCYKILWELQWYMTLHALVCLLQFANVSTIVNPDDPQLFQGF